MSSSPWVDKGSKFPGPLWKRYVGTLCSEAWDLDGPGTEEVVARIEDCVRAGPVTDDDIVGVLLHAQVSETAATLIAPSIRLAIDA